MDSFFLDSFLRILGELSTPSVVRAAEQGGDMAALWEALEESGFLDALVPEVKGGAGLAMADVIPLTLAVGEHLLPVPFAETMVARAMLALGNAEIPHGQPILIWPTTADGRLRSQVNPFETSNALRLKQLEDRLVLTPPTGDAELMNVPGNGIDLMDWAAVLTAARMAGAMKRVLVISLDYVNERKQFGRSLGKFQVIQHQLSVMAEKVVAANVAARIGLSGDDLVLDGWRAATAKLITNESAGEVAAIAHAVHGAIGISEEYDLQLYTRRLKNWQLAYGSESFWARRIGAQRLAMMDGTSVDFIRQGL